MSLWSRQSIAGKLHLVANAVKFTGRRERASITIGSRPDGDGATFYFTLPANP